MNETDQKLIDRCLDGETAAFGRLVERYQDRLFNAMVRILRSHDDARDVTQDAFVQACRKLSSFRGEARFYSWLFRIAYNAAISHKRRTHRRSESLETLNEVTGTETPDRHPDSRPSRRLEQSEQQAMILGALNELSDDYRTVLVLKDIEGVKYEQIAEIIDCPVGTVRSRIHRARSEMREKLRDLLKPD